MINKILLVSFFLIFQIGSIAQQRIDSARCFTLYSDSNSVSLEIEIFYNGSVKKCTFFSSKAEIYNVEIDFDTINKHVRDLNTLIDLYSNSSILRDSSILLVCFLFEFKKGIIDSKVVFSRDLACASAFNRKYLLNKFFNDKVNNYNRKVRNKPLLLFKEYKCNTTTNFSTFY